MDDVDINKHKNDLIDKEIKYFEQLNAGFVYSNCNIYLFSILIHCVENFDIFNIKESNNIENFIKILNDE